MEELIQKLIFNSSLRSHTKTVVLNYHPWENHLDVFSIAPVLAAARQFCHKSDSHLYNRIKKQQLDFKHRKYKYKLELSLPAALGGLGKASRASFGLGKERSGKMSHAAVVDWIWPRAKRKVKSATRMRFGGRIGVRGF